MMPPLASCLDLSGRAAVVAGGAGAIGSAIAARLKECGAAVEVLDRATADADRSLRTRLCDVTDPAAVDAAVADIERAHGRIDILVHAAGVLRDARLWKLPVEDWNRVIAANLTSAFLLLRAVTPVMRRLNGGSVVLISSINGERGKIGQAAYAASKAGVNALTRTAARELGAFGIRVNAVAPGWIDTPMTAAVPEDARQSAIDSSALGRVGTPDDVARAVVFLATNLAGHVTGQVLRVDAGQLIG